MQRASNNNVHCYVQANRSLKPVTSEGIGSGQSFRNILHIKKHMKLKLFGNYWIQDIPGHNIGYQLPRKTIMPAALPAHTLGAGFPER
jgi:hypothetical protein